MNTGEEIIDLANTISMDIIRFLEMHKVSTSVIYVGIQNATLDDVSRFFEYHLSKGLNTVLKEFNTLIRALIMVPKDSYYVLCLNTLFDELKDLVKMWFARVSNDRQEKIVEAPTGWCQLEGGLHVH